MGRTKRPTTKAAKTRGGTLQGKGWRSSLTNVEKNYKEKRKIRWHNYPEWVTSFSKNKDCDLGKIWEAVGFWKRHWTWNKKTWLQGRKARHLACLGFHFLHGSMVMKMLPNRSGVRMTK